MSVYKQWEQAYAFLNDHQLKNPIGIISASASCDSLFQDRIQLFDIFYAAIGSRVFQDHDAKKIREYLYAWERMVTMIECCHRVHELIRNEHLHFSYSGDVSPK
jgi:hypothetical protein